MKILLPLSILALSLATVSCKKDNGDDDKKRTGTFEERIAHTWQLTNVDYAGTMPNPFNASQTVPFSGKGEDVYGEFDFQANYTATYRMGFTALIDIGTSEPARLPFYRPGTGIWWTNSAKDSIFVAESVDTISYQVIEDWDDKQRWQTVLPILDSVSGTFVDVDMQVILRR